MTGHEIKFEEQPWARVPLTMLPLSDSAMRVFVGLHKWRNHDTSQAWPSHATIARYVGKSPATVRRALAELEEHGFVEIRKRSHKDTEGHVTHESNIYTVKYAPPVDRGTTADDSRGSAVGDGRVLPPVSTKPDPLEPEPSNQAPSVIWEPSGLAHIAAARDLLKQGRAQ